MQPFYTINVSEVCGEVVLSQGVILLDQSALVSLDFCVQLTTCGVLVFNGSKNLLTTLKVDYNRVDYKREKTTKK